MKIINLFRKKEPAPIPIVTMPVTIKPPVKKEPVKFEVKFISGRDHEIEKLTKDVNEMLLQGWELAGAADTYRNKILITLKRKI